MFATIRQHWQDFKAEPPGQRFQNTHKKRSKRQGKGKRAALKKWVIIGLGVLLSFAGVFFLAVPGPGLLILAIGLALIAAESITAARILDWLELKFRPSYLWAKRRWQKADHGTRLALSSAAGLLGLGVAVTGYLIFSR